MADRFWDCYEVNAIDPVDARNVAVQRLIDETGHGLASGFTARKPRRIAMHCKSTTMAHGTRSLLFLTVILAWRLTTPWLA